MSKSAAQLLYGPVLVVFLSKSSNINGPGIYQTTADGRGLARAKSCAMTAALRLRPIGVGERWAGQAAKLCCVKQWMRGGARWEPQ